MKSLVLKAEIVNQNNRICNLVDDPIISAYFNAKESIAKYLSIKTAQSRRDYHEELFNILNNYIEQLLKDDAEGILKNAVFHSVRKKKVTSTKQYSKSIKKLAEMINPEGLSLLNLNESLTHDSLRLAYKKAAMKYHPDKGGNVRDMQIINTAYQQFHSILNEEIYFSNKQDEPLINYYEEYIERAKSPEDFYIIVIYILYAAYLDEWAIDKACYWHKNLEQKTSSKKFIDILGIAYLGNPSPGNLGLLFRCFISGLLDDNLICEEFTKTIKYEHEISRATSSLPDGVFTLDFIKEYVYSEHASGSCYGLSYYLDVVCGVIKYKPCLTHYRQLVNARRLGFVDKVNLRKHLKDKYLNGKNAKACITSDDKLE